MNLRKWIVLVMLVATPWASAEDRQITRYVRFQHGGPPQYGVLHEDRIQIIEGDLFGAWQVTPRTVAVKDVRLLAPCTPTKVLAMAYNFASHTVDRDRPAAPLAFAKLPTCIINPGDPIIQPVDSTNLHYEGELVVVFKTTTKGISREEVRDHILGVTIGNDVTDRDWQKQEAQWLRAKATDTFGPLGPCVVSGLNYNDLLIETRLNGVTVQSESTSHYFFNLEECVSYLSRYITFFPGDVLFLGTPGTTRPMKAGDTVEVEIKGIGVLKNRVQSAGAGQAVKAER